jgi:hypothetical protein
LVPKSHYSQLKRLFRLCIPAKTLSKEQARSHQLLLALILEAPTEEEETYEYRVVSYKGNLSTGKVVDAATIQCMVGHVHDRKRWWIIDRSSGLMHTEYVWLLYLLYLFIVLSMYMRHVYKGLTMNNLWAVDLQQTPTEANQQKGTLVGQRIQGHLHGPAGTCNDPHMIPWTMGAEIKTEVWQLKLTAAHPQFFVDPQATIGLSAGFGSTVMQVTLEE